MAGEKFMITTEQEGEYKMKNIAVLGLFKSQSSLEKTVEDLKAKGFRSADISALLPSTDSTKEFAVTNNTKTPEGASTGAVSGLAIGGALGWLAGIGSLAIPGLGALVAAGPIVGMLAGAGAGASVGGLAGALIGFGLPEYEANRYEGRIKDGGLLISVHCDTSEWSDSAEETLRINGATDISTVNESNSDSPSEVENAKPMSMSRGL